MLSRVLLLLLLSTNAYGWFNWFKPRRVCYPHVGCFTASALHPITSVLPMSPDRIQMTFNLYTRQNAATAQPLNPYKRETITRSGFRANRPTVFITHGFTDTATKGWPLTMKDALLRKDDMNVITVDWSRGTQGFEYRQSASNTQVVGATIANMVKALRVSAQLSLHTVHLIGHSLGAHTMGYAGDLLRKQNLGKVGRITGLDPAGLHFERFNQHRRLDASDAEFVDIIHSNGASLLEMAFGIRIPTGHVDFYPNGGTRQPGCQSNWMQSIHPFLSGRINVMMNNVGCSHSRAIHFFIESINSACEFRAYRCTTHLSIPKTCALSCAQGCNRMGYHATKTKPGRFYLKTNAAPPYCK
ncbi:pancreatic lipase-related protein 2-like [Crassostrea virginica]